MIDFISAPSQYTVNPLAHDVALLKAKLAAKTPITSNKSLNLLNKRTVAPLNWVTFQVDSIHYEGDLKFTGTQGYLAFANMEIAVNWLEKNAAFQGSRGDQYCYTIDHNLTGFGSMETLVISLGGYDRQSLLQMAEKLA